VEAVPDGEPGVPEAGADRGAAAPPGRLRPRANAQLFLGGLIAIALIAVAYHFNRPPRHEALSAFPDTLRALGATVLVFGIGGFGLVRLLLPDALRRYELLWVLPTGGCAVGLAMTVLGFAAVPYAVSLPLVLLAGLALGVHAVKRRGWPQRPTLTLAWPIYLALVVAFVALVPMLFEIHYATVTGTGDDAHVAAGTANFLKHGYPTSVHPGLPIDRVPPLWKSKYPIYYAFAAVSSLSGLATWQVLAPLAAALLAMAALGLFLVVREVFGARPAIAIAAMALAGLNREALHTGLNPYFNQTWGYFALPFTLVLGWWLVQPGLGGAARRRVFALLLLFGVVLVFAYPLAAPIPLVPLAVFVWSERRRRIAGGERVLRARDLYHGRRSLVWIVPLCVLLAIPVAAVLQKAVGAASVLAPGHSLIGWGGDMRSFIPFNFFLSLPDSVLGNVLALALLYLAFRGLARQPRALAWGLGGLLALGLLMSAYLRNRQYGYYFHFKLLAFTGPLIVAAATVGAGRLRRAGPALLAVFAVATGISAFMELKATGRQLDIATIRLSDWTKQLPANASIRLDMRPADELWAAYFLASHPVCSQLPLLATDYPHVALSRKADFILAASNAGRPADAVGPPLDTSNFYTLFRESPSVPGVDRCSTRRQSRLFSGADHTKY
jgi:hypothetical protein